MKIKCTAIILFSFIALFAKNPITISFEYDDNKLQNIIVQGEIAKKQWLGVSLYPAEIKDALKDGYHLNRELAPGNFREVISFDSLTNKKFNSSYEIALWGKKVNKKDCPIHDCYWCNKQGYHLEDMLFYQTGYFNITNQKK